MKTLKRILIAIIILISILILISVSALCLLKEKTKNILDDYSSIYTNEKYSEKYLIDNIDIFKQDVLVDANNQSHQIFIDYYYDKL